MEFIKKNSTRLFLAAFLFLPATVFAKDGCDPATSGTICNPLKGSSTIPEFIQKVLEGALKIGFPVIALAIIYCGFLFVEARGNPEKITKARNALMYTLLGAAILLGSWAIAKLISETVLAL